MRQIIGAIACSAWLVGAAQAQAPACGAMADAWPVLERLKGHFKRGEYMAFLENSGPMLAHEVESYTAYFGAMDELFPEGFDRCDTVLVRDEQPAFRQEIIMFTRDDMRGPITLLLTGVVVGDRPQLVQFNFNSAATAVLDDLR